MSFTQFAAGLVLCQLALLCHGKEEFQVESALLRKLLKIYDKDVRTVKNYTDTVTVRHGLILSNLADMDQERGIATLLVWEQMDWHDCMISWDPNNAEGIDRLRIPQSLLWKPDIMLYQRLDVRSHHDVDGLLIVKHTGSVYWTSRSFLKIPCQRRHPDIWHCKMVFGSWVYDANQVALSMRNKDEEINLELYQDQWKIKIIENTATHHQTYYPGWEAPFDDITYDLYLKMF